MRRTIARLWLWWKNYRVYRRRAFALAWMDACEGIETGSTFVGPELDDEYQHVDTFLIHADSLIESETAADPFGSFKRVNEEINNAE